MQHIWRQRLLSLRALGAQAELMSPHVELSADSGAVIEGCAGVLSYDETSVRLNCKTLILRLDGFDLCLNHLSGGLVSVSGKIVSLTFLPV